MYPAYYYQTFMRYQASNEVFVAMPFNNRFKRIFETVIEPAITQILADGLQLKANVINRNISGAPDIHEKIYDAIIHSRLVIADMTVQAHYVGDDGVARWQANSNVAYEVGLASAWRNPEDIILIHQPHHEHTYSFDVQNLRHVEYNPDDRDCVALIAKEIMNALAQSTFLATHAYQKIVDLASPDVIQFMREEINRPFPQVGYRNRNLPVANARSQVIADLLAVGAVKRRHILPQEGNRGIGLIYQWTELGLRLASSLVGLSDVQRTNIISAIDSVPEGQIPPMELLDLPGA